MEKMLAPIMVPTAIEITSINVNGLLGFMPLLCPFGECATSCSAAFSEGIIRAACYKIGENCTEMPLLFHRKCNDLIKMHRKILFRPRWAIFLLKKPILFRKFALTEVVHFKGWG
jgi:hypothetical protein